MTTISQRKTDHLDLAVSGDVGFRAKTSLFDDVTFVHNALPELSWDELDLSCRVFGKMVRAPLLIAGMTGGTERARQINSLLAEIAEERGYAFGLGSQRAMLRDPSLRDTYGVRDVAPTAPVLGNLGAVQAAELETGRVADLVRAVGADALCVHLNPAMEVIQSEGDRDFRGCLDAIARLSSELDVPVVAKETGCGLSSQVARRLAAAGVRHVDVSGAGGTSWVGVETARAQPDRRAIGETFWDWGIPTAASVALVAPHGFRTVFATGGVASGLDVAKAIALGAHVGGIARPVLQALEGGGRDAASAYLEQVESELRTAMLLVGARKLSDLREAPRLVRGELAAWIAQGQSSR